MAFDDYKITPSDYSGRDISGLADRPALSAYELKARFDSLVKNIVAAKLNGLIGELKSAFDGIVPAARLINGKPLSEDVDLTPADIGAASKSGDAMAGPLTAGGAQAVGAAQVRNIYAGTAELAPGSPLPTGTIYIQYE